MRIALLDPASYTAPYDHGLAAALAGRGHEVELLTSAFVFGEAPEPDGYRRRELFFPLSTRLFGRAPRSRLRFLLKGAEYLPGVRALLTRVEELDPDVVHAQWLPLPRLDVRWVRRLAAERATVLTAHDVVPRRRGQLAAWKDVLVAVHRVVVHSRRGVEQLAELGVERERVTRIPHPFFAGPAAEPEPPGGHTLLFFGLLRGYKGLDLLVSAFAHVLAAVPDARLVVAGDPVESVEPVRQLAGRLGVAERIEWRLRFVGPDEAAELMREAAAVVLPYRRIDSSGVLATAIGHGRPAVVTDVGGLGETVGEFGAGLVVPPEDVPALAAACVRLLTDEGALTAAFRGTAAARAGLSWERSAAAHERLYAELATAVG